METVSVWLRARDETADLHLVAVEGLRAGERTRFAVEPMPLATLRTVIILRTVPQS